VPLGFARLRSLRLFYADIWCRFGRAFLRRASTGSRALAGRFVSEIPSHQVISFSLGAIGFKAMQHFKRGRESPADLGEEFCRFGRWFARQVCGHLRESHLDPERDVFFGYDTNSLEILQHLKSRKVFTVLDQVDPGLEHETSVLEEIERWPGWQRNPGRMPPSYWDRRRQEWAMADVVLVNSEWSRQAIARQGVPADKIIVVPLGIDLHREPLPAPLQPNGDLTVLYLGSLVLGKGIQYFVEAARALQHEPIRFVAAGPIGLMPEALRRLPSNIQVLGRITRDKLGEVYRQAHVFVLPTISDGFAATQLEAMARGLPVVVTPNCGRVVTHGHDGLLVPARDSQALADALLTLNHNRQLVADMSENALRTVQHYDLCCNARRTTVEVAKHFFAKARL